METIENIARTIRMAKRFFGSESFTREKFEQYAQDIQGASFWTLYEFGAIIETGETISVLRILTPQEFAAMVNECVANDTYDCKWKWYVNQDGNFEATQLITVYRMV